MSTSQTPLDPSVSLFHGFVSVKQRETSIHINPLESPCFMFHPYIHMKHETTPTATPPIESVASVGELKEDQNAILKPSEVTKSVIRELSVLKPSPAVGAVLDELPGRYAPYRSSLWGNAIRHHCLGGRTESERFMDRRSWGDFENRAIRRMQGAPVSEDDASTFAPSKRKIYPARVSKEDVRRRALKEAVCLCGCGRKLNAKRRKAKWATDACRMRAKRKG